MSSEIFDFDYFAESSYWDFLPSAAQK